MNEMIKTIWDFLMAVAVIQDAIQDRLNAPYSEILRMETTLDRVRLISGKVIELDHILIQQWQGDYYGCNIGFLEGGNMMAFNPPARMVKRGEGGSLFFTLMLADSYDRIIKLTK